VCGYARSEPTRCGAYDFVSAMTHEGNSTITREGFDRGDGTMPLRQAPEHHRKTAETSIAMERSVESEILDGKGVREELVVRAYRELTGIHRLLGDTRSLVQALRRDPLPVQRVLDIGCGRGGVLEEVTRALGVEGVGIDISPPEAGSSRILKADAVCDPLPEADVAFSIHVAHHLSEVELVQMIRNVGRSCRRFILLDVVRDRVPLALFRTFVTPFVSPITAADGRTSIRRAYAPSELGAVVALALTGTNARFRHFVAPLGVRQTVDISYASE
jgi:SAM-dependent methyltransferase